MSPIRTQTGVTAASLATADTTSARLLEALLHEALTPGEEQEAA